MIDTENSIINILTVKKSILIQIPLEVDDKKYIKEIYVYMESNEYILKYDLFLEEYEDATDLYENREVFRIDTIENLLKCLREITDPILKSFNEYLQLEYKKYIKFF